MATKFSYSLNLFNFLESLQFPASIVCIWLKSFRRRLPDGPQAASSWWTESCTADIRSAWSQGACSHDLSCCLQLWSVCCSIGNRMVCPLCASVSESSGSICGITPCRSPYTGIELGSSLWAAGSPCFGNQNLELEIFSSLLEYGQSPCGLRVATSRSQYASLNFWNSQSCELTGANSVGVWGLANRRALSFGATAAPTSLPPHTDKYDTVF